MTNARAAALAAASAAVVAAAAAPDDAGTPPPDPRLSDVFLTPAAVIPAPIVAEFCLAST